MVGLVLQKSVEVAGAMKYTYDSDAFRDKLIENDVVFKTPNRPDTQLD